ncbi:hypothetical protein MKI79_01685 [Acinetobacter sp. A3.8]|uniref:Uncharacterized protein n=1 Tax=Acinetobacter sedimenti TaxID=2919922 RepID=A0A9X1WUT3_9GAMM|nr:DUF6587 family protein [Acinetobacter sedimenti]MCJ8145634.1 hypothetical protein [Acinetobacter sedimenti]
MIEMLIITLLVLWSVLVVFKKVFPNTAKKTFSALSNFSQNRGWSTLAKWLAPKAPVGCGGGCGCDTENDPSDGKSAQKIEIQTVKWK